MKKVKKTAKKAFSSKAYAKQLNKTFGLKPNPNSPENYGKAMKSAYKATKVFR